MLFVVCYLFAFCCGIGVQVVYKFFDVGNICFSALITLMKFTTPTCRFVEFSYFLSFICFIMNIASQ